MHYYRYRPFSELSLKELAYSEIYFASTDECNDPFDSKAFYSFNSNQEKWAKLIEFTCNNFNIKIDPKTQQELGEYISSKCPLTFDEVTGSNLLSNYKSTIYSSSLFKLLGGGLQEVLKIYSPAARYFVSFSKTNNEPLMWSHYSNRHDGFCLIFKALDGKILLNPKRPKGGISRKTKNGLAPQMSFGFPKDFTFQDINYKSKVKSLDAFLHMPVFVSGNAKDEKQRKKIQQLQESHYIQKARNWEYEKESRLILPPPPSWLFGEHIEYTKQERLFHYEPSQLVGIVYGARLKNENRERIREILNSRSDYQSMTVNYKRTEFHFIEFQANLSINQRELEVVPLNILSYKPIPPTDKDFDRLYSDWRTGYGWEKEENRSSRKLCK